MTSFLQILLVGVALATFLAPGPATAQDAIKVGIVLPLTGDQAKFGEIEKLSFYLALEEINAAGGIKGKKLQFLFADDTGNPEVGRTVMEKLIKKDKVVMLGGGYASAVTYAMAGVAQQNRIPFLINTGSADVITEKGYDYIFRLNPTVSDYTSGLESFLTAVVKPKNVVILHESSLFGAEGAKAFKNTCEKLGIKVLMVEGYEGWFRAFDFQPLLMRVKQANPDLVYMISYLRDATLLMQLAREMKLTPKLFVGGAAGFTLPEFAQEAGKAAEKVISVTLWHQSLPIPGAREYFDKFKATYQRDTEYHGAEAYAAAYVMTDVLKRAKSLAPEDIKQALKETDMQTVFGPVKFVSYGKMTNQNRLNTYVVQWQEGKLRLIWPADLAQAKYVYPVDWLKEWGFK
ncbi:MAG: ABC transporter substrate-binding protein [Deltaproteobacteria bacterium]|nr:ABC transporter substrate-binding protein [Deltaproteobacteria bacterium]MBI4795204.1 ABC transporter substrate-binding protein [Deltaproteobacteria bacterium]